MPTMDERPELMTPPGRGPGAPERRRGEHVRRGRPVPRQEPGASLASWHSAVITVRHRAGPVRSRESWAVRCSPTARAGSPQQGGAWRVDEINGVLKANLELEAT